MSRNNGETDTYALRGYKSSTVTTSKIHVSRITMLWYGAQSLAMGWSSTEIHHFYSLVHKNSKTEPEAFEGEKSSKHRFRK